jgi:hypothetical protein
MTSVADKDWESKCTLICKPEQSGKTFVMIQQIIRDLSEPTEGKKIVNIILCDNNLLLTKQTGERVKNDLSEFQRGGGDDVDELDELYLELSSSKRTNYHTADSVVGALVTKPVKNVLCCANGVRVDDIYSIIDGLSGVSDRSGDEFSFKVWLDEADKFIPFIDQTFKDLLRRPNVQLYCITATPKALFKKYNSMNVLPIENTTSDKYHGWADNKITLIDDSVPTGSAFVKHVLDTHQGLIVAGTKWFIPASYTKKSHNEVKDICVEMGFAVLVVNGDGLSLTLPKTKELILYKKDDELNVKIMQMYQNHSLDSSPFAITGNICISRGISIMSEPSEESEGFMLDYGILSICSNQQEASQNSGRLKGNIKGWGSYKPPVVFTTTRFNDVAEEWESKSRGLAELAFKLDAEGKSTVITKTEFKTLGEGYGYTIHDEEFASFAKAIAFLKKSEVKERMKAKPIASKKGACHQTPGGYWVTSKLTLKSGMRDEDRKMRSDLANIGAGTSISSTEKGSRFLIVPFYDTQDTPPNKEKYQVRYIDFKK